MKRKYSLHSKSLGYPDDSVTIYEGVTKLDRKHKNDQYAVQGADTFFDGDATAEDNGNGIVFTISGQSFELDYSEVQDLTVLIELISKKGSKGITSRIDIVGD